MLRTKRSRANYARDAPKSPEQNLPRNTAPLQALRVSRTETWPHGEGNTPSTERSQAQHARAAEHPGARANPSPRRRHCPCQHPMCQVGAGLQSCQTITFHQILQQDLCFPPTRSCPHPKAPLPASCFAESGLGLSSAPGWVRPPHLPCQSPRQGGR